MLQHELMVLLQVDAVGGGLDVAAVTKVAQEIEGVRMRN